MNVMCRQLVVSSSAALRRASVHTHCAPPLGCVDAISKGVAYCFDLFMSFSRLVHVVVAVKLKQTPCRSPPQHFGLFECFMSSSGNLLVRRGRPPSQTPRVIRVGKAPKSPLSLRVRSPDVAVRSAVHTVPLPGHSALDVEPDDGFLPVPETHHAESSDVSGKVIKKRVSKIIRWGTDDTPTEAEIMILAERKRSKYHLGMSALHWACESHLEDVVSCIIQRNLVPVDALAEHHKFISFTPVFSGISLMWLRSEGDSENGIKVPKKGLQKKEEQMCFSVLKKLACAGAKLDGQVTFHLNRIREATLLHIAADYACLFNGRVFQQRYPFFLSVAHLLAQHLKPSEFAALFRNKCKVDGETAVSVCWCFLTTHVSYFVCRLKNCWNPRSICQFNFSQAA